MSTVSRQHWPCNSRLPSLPPIATLKSLAAIFQSSGSTGPDECGMVPRLANPAIDAKVPGVENKRGQRDLLSVGFGTARSLVEVLAVRDVGYSSVRTI